MKWIGQHIWSFISRFRNDVYLEDVESGTIASGGNLGLDSNNKIVKATSSGGISFDGSTADGILTYKDSDEATVESNLTYDGTDLTAVSSSDGKPVLTLKTTHTNVDSCAELQFLKDAADTEDGESLGLITFYGEDEGNNNTKFAQIRGKITESDDSSEGGSLRFAVAAHDGEMRNGLIINDGNAEDEVDVTIGDTATSLTTIAGTLTMGSTATLDNNGLLQVANQSNITGVGAITSGSWTGDPIASAYLDSDTAHLSGVQTFTGKKIFSATITQDGDNTVVPGDGAALHFDASDITDGNTSASGTAAKFTHVNIEAPTLLATNASVTTSDAATLYINSAPSASTNQTITRRWSMWVDAGHVRFDGSIYSGTTEAMNSSGLLTVANQTGITGVGTISSGTWQGTSIGTAYTDAKVTSIVAGDGIDVSGATGDVTVTAETATDSNPGVVELATTAEAVTGTDTDRAVTPAGLKARVSQIINLKGYLTLQDGVYDYANPFNTDDEAPFQIDTSYGSGTIDSSTEVAQNKLFRSGGFHVPFACTITDIHAQVTCNNAGNVSIAIVEYRPSSLASDQNDYPRTVYETVVVASADNNNKVTSTTIATGDLDATAVPAGSHIMMMVKGDGTSAGGTTIVSVAVGLSW